MSDLLVVALFGAEVPVDPQAVFDVRGMKFTEPQFHQPTSWVRMLMCSMSGSSGPVMEQPLALAYWMYSRISLVIRSPGPEWGFPGVAHDKLAAHLVYAVLQGDALLVGVEGLLGLVTTSGAMYSWFIRPLPSV